MIRDIHFALRALIRTPVFTAVAVLMLAVGIGLSIFMFGAINQFSLRPLPFLDAERLVHIEYTDSHESARRLALPQRDWLDLRERQSVFPALSGYSIGTMNLGGIDGPPERLSGAWVGNELFSTLGIAPILGRDLSAADTLAGAEPVVLIGHRVWQLRFQSDPGVIGRSLRINGQPARVIGVMPERFAFPSSEALWMPLSTDVTFAKSDRAMMVSVVARLPDGSSLGAAALALDTLIAALAGERSEPLRGDRAGIDRFEDAFVNAQFRSANTTMFVAVLLVLLIACANVASLVLARFAARSRELAVRSALGATRRRLILQVLTETCVIAFVAAGLGYLGADIAAQLMHHTMQQKPSGLPYWIENRTDLRDVLFTVGIAAAAAVLAGLVPALKAGRIDPQDSLRGGNTIGAGSRIGRYLVVGEVALCVILLVGAGIAIRSARTVQQTDLGIDDSGVLTGRIALFGDRYPDSAARLGFVDALRHRLQDLPGVSRIAFASTLPLMGYERQPYARVDDQFDRDTRLPQAWSSSVSADFFASFGIALRDGRGFDNRDSATSPPVAIVSSSFAAAAWPNRDAVGQRVRLSPRDVDSPWLEVVGVVADSLQADYLLNDSTPQAHRGDGNVFRPLAQNPPGIVSVVLRADGDPNLLGEGLRQAVLGIDADLPVYWLKPMREWREQLTWGSDVLARLFGVFAGFALLLAAAGIYAVLAFDVARRTREIGVRRALGAPASGVLMLTLKRGGGQVSLGLLIGSPLALLLSRVLDDMMVSGSQTDPRVYVGVVTVLVLAVLAAAIVPARRALRIDPMEALRHE